MMLFAIGIKLNARLTDAGISRLLSGALADPVCWKLLPLWHGGCLLTTQM